jgi:chromosome segregation ATPase
MDPIIVETMNDIINQVDAREWRRVNGHRDRMMKKWKREKAKVEEMKDEWEVATEKIGQENSDLHNEIKRLKNEIKRLKKENTEVEKLKFNLKRAEDALDEQMEKNEDLKEELREAQNPSRETIKSLVEENFMCEPMSASSNTQCIYHWYSDDEEEED